MAGAWRRQTDDSKVLIVREEQTLEWPDFQTVPVILSVNDLKQFLYCPRILYYHWVMPVRPPSTFLMQRGHRQEDRFEQLEPRRVLNRYGFQEATRHFGLEIADESLGLIGKVDLILESPARVAVVEFKATASRLAENWKLQLCAYGLLAEHRFQRPCPLGFVMLNDSEELIEVQLDEALRREAVYALKRARELVMTRQFPDATQIRARCGQCEYRNFCGDVF
jgi:CRISPR-associated exonuclease Cas4